MSDTTQETLEEEEDPGQEPPEDEQDTTEEPLEDEQDTGQEPPEDKEDTAEEPVEVKEDATLLTNSNSKSTVLVGVICKIGPSSDTPEMLVDMMAAGMCVAKVSCSLGTQDDHARKIRLIREAVDMYGLKHDMVYPLAILMETKGPEVHLGRLAAGEDAEIELITGETVILTSDKEYENEGSTEILYVDYPNMTHDMEPLFSIYFSKGFVKLKVTEVGSQDITCSIECGGKVNSYDLVNLPSNSIALPTLSEKDKEDILFAVEQQIDILSVSFVRSGNTVKEVRELMGEKGKNIFILGNIEDQEGFEHVDEILAEADGLLIARGNLGINLDQQKLFLAQKIIIGKCNKAGKPVVIGTQMLKSMVENPFASSAEVTDIANAVVEGADCVALNDETHHGHYPLECLRLMGSVLKEAEQTICQNRVFSDLYMHCLPPVSEPVVALAIATVKMSMKINAAAIVVVTSTGRSAVELARWRPRCPIISVTRYGYVARKLEIYKAVFPLHYTSPPMSLWQVDVDARLQYGISYGKQLGFIKGGDPILLVSGWHHGAGFTNTIRMIFAAQQRKEPSSEEQVVPPPEDQEVPPPDEQGETEPEREEPPPEEQEPVEPEEQGEPLPEEEPVEEEE